MRKLVMMFLILCISTQISSCTVEYQDTNGTDDYNLQTITDENIIHLDVGSSGLGYRESNFAGVLLSSEYYSKNFNGVEQIYLTNFILPSDIEIYIGTINVKSGNFKLSVINNDEIIFEIPLDAFGETFRFENITGSFSIHAAGESAAFECSIDIQ